MYNGGVTPLPFIGRRSYLHLLNEELAQVRKTGSGRFVVVRGRRRIGKSRLMQEFLSGLTTPTVFFTATSRTPREELELFRQELALSSVGAPPDLVLGSWTAALSFIALESRKTKPTVVVIDEFPYLAASDQSLEAELQRAWDRILRDVPVMLILVGSDLAMMDALTAYSRPLYGRPNRVISVEPFTVSEVAEALKLDAAAAIDANLVVGGFPELVRAWPKGASVSTFLKRQLAERSSPLIGTAERVLDAELPPDTHARAVLTAIGAGASSFQDIANRAGVPQATLLRSLKVLVEEKEIVSAERPLSLKRSRETRYRVNDSYLRFYIRMIEPRLALVDRDLGSIAAENIMTEWLTYRGMAVEPLVRERMTRIGHIDLLTSSGAIGAYWTRNNSVEVDIVGLDSDRRSKRVTFVGQIKWRDRQPFTVRDRDALVALRAKVPGTDANTALIGVSRTGFKTSDLDLALGPDDLVKLGP